MSEADCSLVVPHLKQLALQTCHTQACSLGEGTHRPAPYCLILRGENIISGRWAFAGFSAVTEMADTKMYKNSSLVENQKWVSEWLFLLEVDCSFRMSKSQKNNRSYFIRACTIKFVKYLLWTDSICALGPTTALFSICISMWISSWLSFSIFKQPWTV